MKLFGILKGRTSEAPERTPLPPAPQVTAEAMAAARTLYYELMNTFRLDTGALSRNNTEADQWCAHVVAECTKRSRQELEAAMKGAFHFANNAIPSPHLVQDHVGSKSAAGYFSLALYGLLKGTENMTK